MTAPRRAVALLGGLSLLTLPLVTVPAHADVSATISTFPYSQSWSDAGLITTNDDWSGVPGVQGYRGDDLTGATGADPQTITADGSGTPTDVNANATTASTTGGVIEIDGDTIAIQGSGTADAPHVVFHVDLTGQAGSTFSFDAKDLDGSGDDAVQSIAVQYRVGSTGDYTNLPDGYIADATSPGAASLTHKDVVLPAGTDGQADVFVRVLTTNAAGNDELVGIDDVTITAEGSGSSSLAATDPDDVTATVDEAISPIMLRASGGTSPYTWDVSGLPVGLSETSEGIIEGTPTETGVSSVTATVTDSATPSAATDSVEFTVTVEEAKVFTIAEIQGTGAATPLSGQTVTTRGVVTAAYPTGGFFAFVIQTVGTGAGADATPGASDALWVYQASGGVGVEIGQHVEVTGAVAERFGRTELSYDPSVAALKVLSGSVDPVTPLATGYWPAEAEREAHESELLDLGDQAFTVTDNYSINQYGEVGLATGDRPLVTPTEVANPNLDAAGYEAAVAENAARGVILDDGSSWNYVTRATATSMPLPWIDRETTARVGASAALSGPVVLDYGFSKWRLQPTSQVNGPQPELVSFGDTRPENTTPEAVGGDLRIATFNVLNYFNTTGMEFEAAGGECSFYTDRVGDEVTNNRCNPDGPRGAAEDEDLARQQVKIVEAINTLDAAVVSLEEIENSIRLLGETDRDDALAELTGALNQAAGRERWAFVPSPPAEELPASEDVIRTAFIYDPSVVALEGGSVIFDDPAFSNARQPLAQAFRPAGTTEAADAFAVVANHFKSKGSACDGEPNGPQGNCNQSRVTQARALDAFADSFAAERDLEQVFLAGDFNSYSEEDPMIVLENLGYTKLESATEDEWSYSFDGMSGSLDHVLANDAALAQVTGVDIWEINANEALAFEYSRFNYNVTEFYEENVFRASDHNPELVGIDVRDTSAVSLTLAPSRIKQKKDASTATVTIDGVDDTATGTVRFYVDGEPVGQRALLDGTAEIRIGPFERGSYEITVEYLGDDDNLPGTDAATLLVGNS